ncbi:hypothetical protein EJ05DRAFT_512920 [Pseudovirgaria hyperparasitica]|uniref:Uncharacterized protein n=1 Tax=Pseudovirgaria hyperparasitica TaxID=470096 RepID=A0A6A6W088_9PEZI|nr:uncharacterized protein EJ05DRAFT_512920 [Pseudovirgaria hyperparasitica]KAF2755404.1 hypothetical protein EJ05DRAFT_512920 [Pseudovirgaria hyperparasitica]
MCNYIHCIYHMCNHEGFAVATHCDSARNDDDNACWSAWRIVQVIEEHDQPCYACQGKSWPAGLRPDRRAGQSQRISSAVEEMWAQRARAHFEAMARAYQRMQADMMAQQAAGGGSPAGGQRAEGAPGGNPLQQYAKDGQYEMVAEWAPRDEQQQPAEGANMRGGRKGLSWRDKRPILIGIQLAKQQTSRPKTRWEEKYG